MVCLVTMPFLLFWGMGLIFQVELDYLVKLGLFVVLYLYTNVMNQFVLDHDKLFSILPLSIYFANKFYFYVTWLGFVAAYVDTLTTLIFLAVSALLWYNFLKAWKGDPGLIKTSEDQRFRAIVELAERSKEKNPFDPKSFCPTCLVRRPLR